MIGIYKITSPSGKIYVGQSVNIIYRFNTYKRLHCKSQTKLYNSILKHGFDKHKFEIICECEISELNDKERYYQELYSCIGKNGLNCNVTKSQDKKGYLSEETKDKVRQSLKGKKRCPSIGIKTGNSLRGRKIPEETLIKLRGKTPWNKGIKSSDETRKKISENTTTRIIINIISKEKYKSIKKASEKENIKYCYLRQMLSGVSKNTTNLIYYESTF